MSQNASDLPYALVVAHPDATIHVRVNEGHHGRAVAALCAAVADFTVDLVTDAAGDPRCRGIRAWVHPDEYRPGDALVIADHLTAAGMVTFTYEAFRDEGRLELRTRYRHAGAGAVPSVDHDLLFVLDHDLGGYWYLGAARLLALVDQEATRRGVDAVRVEGSGGLEALVLPPSSRAVQMPMRVILTALGIHVHRMTAGTVGVGGPFEGGEMPW